MVFQNYALYPHMTAYKNMAFGLSCGSTTRAEIDRRVRDAARILGPGGVLDKRPRHAVGWSAAAGGHGRAIVREPQAFLMDEPLSNLDAKLRVRDAGPRSPASSDDLEVTTIYVTTTRSRR